MLQIDKTVLEGVLILEPRRFGDERGWFSEVYSRRALAEAGIATEFVQDNHSFSRPAGTLRGLHFQRPPHAQAKLVRVAQGSVLDVVVDIRAGSPTYGRHLAVELSAANGRQMFVPQGFLHGFVTLEPDTAFLYKCSDYYAPDCEGTVAWNDPALAIDWPFAADELCLSEKDRIAPPLSRIDNPFRYEETQ